MEWVQFIIFFLGVFGLFIWNRTESRTDMRHMDLKIDAMREDSKSFQDAIREDMRDFHAKLCTLEEKYIQMMQRYWENR